MGSIYLGVFTAVLLLLQTNVAHGQTYSIVHPKLLRIDTNENFIINLHGYGNALVDVYASLKDYPRGQEFINSTNHQEKSAGEPISFALNVPRAKLASETIANKRVELHVRITIPNHPQINKKKLIYLTGESDYIFVQTDRPIYKPGENVRIRVIPLNSEMLPLRQNLMGGVENIEVSVRTKEGVGIWKEYSNFRSDAFVASTYKIPTDPPLGSYYVVAKVNNSLHTSEGSAEFKVDKYVLPMYKVTIDLEQSYVRPNGKIKATIKAMYSYGEPVVGLYAFSASVVIPGRQPEEIYKRPSSYRKRPKVLLNGEAEITIPVTIPATLPDMTWENLIAAKASVSVTVSVMGKAEQTFESAQKDGILITKTPYLIDMSRTPKYYVGGLEQDINVIVRDIVTKKTVPGVRVVLGSGQHGNTDDEGTVQIPIFTPTSGNQISVTVRTDDSQIDNDDQAQKIFTLNRHQSGAGYLRLSADSHATVGQNLYVKFRARGANPTEIFYLVLSKGRIILSGKHSRSSSARESSQAITITRKMSPSIRVVAYFMNSNNMVSDSLSVDIDDVCISEELAISVDKTEIEPGQTVAISYKGEPRAMIGTSAVDRSAYYLNEKGRLNRHKMFHEMESFDMGCSVAGGSNGLNVFQEAGLSFASSSVSSPTQSNITCPDKTSSRKRKKRGASTIQQVTSHDELLRRICKRDGRQENLANETCEERKLRILKLDWNSSDTNICTGAFLEGCELGEFIRDFLQKGKETQRSSSSHQGIDVASQQRQMKRTNFEEGWLWNTEVLSGGGKFSHTQRPPHSITTYDIDALSVHNTEGFCVAKPAELKVFKDFFVQLYLPYSVKIMEQVQIRAAFFNYHPTEDREVELRIKGDRHLCTQYTAGTWSDVASLTVEKQSSKSIVFSAIPLSIPEEGYTEIELEVLSMDFIRRKLKIEPSGTEEEFSGSLSLDPERSNQQINLEFPDDNVIPGTKKCWIYGHMSYLGPLLQFDPISETPQNLDNSISLPHGCGEQNMKSVGPNVFVFNYLKFIRDPKPSEQAQIKTFIIDGYTRQQSHRNNGKWAIWSYYAPTIWLNAYVNKVFLHSREVWSEMDIRPICTSLDWIEKQQKPNGAFSEQAHSRHYWVNVAEGGEVALTAYVLISVAETYVECPEKSLNSRINTMMRKAETYLRGVPNPDIPYTAAITAYALALADSRHPATLAANRKLLNLKRQNGDEIFWKGPQQSNRNIPTWRRRKQTPIDIETTAYALLAQVKLAQEGSDINQGTIQMINSIARWMVNQQNDRGGFQSSQTTVVAIQSMTEYAKWIEDAEPQPRNPHLNIVLTAPGNQEWRRGLPFNIDERHEFYRKELEVPAEVIRETRVIQVAVPRGEGRGTLSYRCIYRQTSDSEVCDFNIIATTELVGHMAEDGEGEAAPGEGKNVFKLVLDIQKLSDGDSGMAIIDIGLISGLVPIESTLDAIKIGNTVDGLIDDYEIHDEKVIIYVEKIPNQSKDSLTLGFKLQEAVAVKGASPAKIVVYDYYKPDEVTCSKSYSLPGGSPTIRTSCSATSIDDSTQQICKCAEGACPTCRTREEQLVKTCATTNRSPDCHDLHRSICGRNYGFFVNVTEVDIHSMPQFVKMTAVVEEVIHRRSEDSNVARNRIRTFIIRKDCFDRCSVNDVSVKILSDSNYFAAGRSYLVRGREPEKIVKSSGGNRFDYYFDKDAVIERTLSRDKCEKFEKFRVECKGQRKKSPKCKSKLQKLRICDNQEDMRQKVIEGCD
ncbi:A.superbus venom factor 1-like [Styela clava]